MTCLINGEDVGSEFDQSVDGVQFLDAQSAVLNLVTLLVVNSHMQSCPLVTQSFGVDPTVKANLAQLFLCVL